MSIIGGVSLPLTLQYTADCGGSTKREPADIREQSLRKCPHAESMESKNMEETQTTPQNRKRQIDRKEPDKRMSPKRAKTSASGIASPTASAPTTERGGSKETQTTSQKRKHQNDIDESGINPPRKRAKKCSNTTATPPSSAPKTGFGKLSRELRDMVYEEILKGTKPRIQNFSWTNRRVNSVSNPDRMFTPPWSPLRRHGMLLVNKQFGAEFRVAARPHIDFHVEINAETLPIAIVLLNSNAAQLQHISHLTIDFTEKMASPYMRSPAEAGAENIDHFYQSQIHHNLTEMLYKMPKLVSLRLVQHPRSSPCVHTILSKVGCRLNETNEAETTMKGSKRLPSKLCRIVARRLRQVPPLPPVAWQEMSLVKEVNEWVEQNIYLTNKSALWK